MVGFVWSMDCGEKILGDGSKVRDHVMVNEVR